MAARSCSRSCSRSPAIFLPGFLLKKAATEAADTIDGQMPHFVDQLAIAIEAGMSFDAALTYLSRKRPMDRSPRRWAAS